MKVALKDFLESEVGKGMEAVLVGTRRGDPHGGEFLSLHIPLPTRGGKDVEWDFRADNKPCYINSSTSDTINDRSIMATIHESSPYPRLVISKRMGLSSRSKYTLLFVV